MRTKHGSGVREHLINIAEKLKGPGQVLGNIGTAIWSGERVMDLYNTLASTAGSWLQDLPDLRPELDLFIARSQTTGPHQDLYKQILYKLLDMNRRYLQLNTVPGAKRQFTRIMHVTALNSIRDPQKAMEYLGHAELDLAKLYQDHLGSPRDLSKRTWAEWADETFVKPDVSSKYRLEYLGNTRARAAADANLPTAILYDTPFPDADVSGRYVPPYLKAPHPTPLPSYQPRGKQAPVRYVNRYRRRVRRVPRRR